MNTGLLGLCCLASFACGQEDDAPLYKPVSGKRDRLPADGVCDIAETACQELVLRATLDVRGGELDLPEISVITPEEFVDQVLDASEPGDLEPPPDAWVRALSLFDLMPRTWTTSDDLSQLANGVAAAYFHDGDFIVVLDHGEGTANWESMYSLSHEMVHALQDVDYDLAGIQDDFADASTDGVLGMLGLIEGEAVLYSTLAMLDTPPETASEWDRFYELYIAAVEDAALQGPSPYADASLVFPYAQGARFVTDAWLQGGAEGVRDLYAAVPGTTRQILAGPALATPRGGWSADLSDSGEGTLPEGFELIEHDSLGAWLFDVFLRRGRVEDGELPGTGLLGDELLALSNGSDVVAVWRLRFAAEQLAPMRALLQGLDSRYRVEQRGEDLLLFSAASGVDLGPIASAFQLPDPSSAVANSAAAIPARLPWSSRGPISRRWSANAGGR